MAYKHGTYGEYMESISTIPLNSDTNIVYVGTAPINLVRGWKDKNLVNFPVEISSDSARTAVGYSDDWETFTLGEVIDLHYNNEIQTAGPITVINVLDPDVHKKAEATTTELNFINDYARIAGDKIILDTLALADMAEGVDYEVTYDVTAKETILHKLDTEKPTTVNVTYSEVDTSAIKAATIVGNVTEDGDRTGLDVLYLVYQELGTITNLLVAPGWSDNKEVYNKMLQVSQKINGHWDCMVLADIPITNTDTKEKAIKWKSDNGYTSEWSKACWPMWKTNSGKLYHLSTVTAWQMMCVDSEHDGIPMETPSNKIIPSGRQYFGETSKNKGYDQMSANELNEHGITTAVYWAGYNVLWGGHTAAYEYGNVSDKRAIFDNSIRMMMYISNAFQEDNAAFIDEPMTKSLADTIKAREQEKMDALVSIGALIGNPVVTFEPDDNKPGDLVEGNFVWRQKGTPTPPFKSGTLRIAYTDEGFSTYYEGEEAEE